MKLNKLLIAIDNSPCSEKAAIAGYELAKQFSTEVALVNIIEPLPPNTNPDLNLTPYFLDIYEDTEENSKALLKEIEKQFSHGLPTTHFTVMDSAAHGIVQIAEEWAADLIVIGSHGRSGFSHFLLGSVSEHVARKSACPVLIIPSKCDFD